MGRDLGWYTPLFDVQVSAQKQSPYTKLSQNELALQFFGAGFFDPLRAKQALICLDMMDFDRKDMVMKAVRENGRDAGLPVKALPAQLTPGLDTLDKVRAKTAEIAAPR